MNTSAGESFRLAAKIILTLAVLAAVYAWIVKPLLATDEDKLNAIAVSALDAAAHRRVGDLLKDIAEDYSDAFNGNRRDLQAALNYVMLMYKEWRVELLEAPQVALAPDKTTATVTLRVALQLLSRPNDPPGVDQVAATRGTDLFRLHCEKRDNRWWIVRCDGGDEGK